MIDKNKLIFKNSNLENAKKSLEVAAKVLSDIDEADFNFENIKNFLIKWPQ